MEIRYLSWDLSVLNLKAAPCVMAIGYFDGVHLGHRKVIGTAGNVAEKLGVPLAVMTFYPHPKEVLGKGGVDYLMPMPRKEAVFAEMGVDVLYVVKFTPSFARMSPKDFARKFVAGLGAVHVVTGEDFTYGRKGAGNVHTLEVDGEYAYGVTAVPLLALRGGKVSSTRIRGMLRAGDVDGASALLGEHYATFGKITDCSFDEEKGLVKAHIAEHSSCMLPAAGMYKVSIVIGAEAHPGVAAVEETGVRAKRLEIRARDSGCAFSGDTDIIIRWLGRIGSQTAAALAAAY